MVGGRKRAATVAQDREEQRWEALLARHKADGDAFFYAVRTTGVFCRPECASRRPLRRNVRFFDQAADAIREGYRPCKRCQPLGPLPQTTMLVRACAMLGPQGFSRNRDVAKSLGMSTSYFQRMFKKHLGVTPQQYRRRLLSDAGRQALRRASSVTESVYAAGYSSSSRFYEGVGRELGMTPSTALQGGPGETIHYSTASCSFGTILIAWTTRGLCEVALGDDANELAARLGTHFPESTFEACEPSAQTRALIDAVERGSRIDLPLDVQGTAFQERVWQALREIPFGETRTYTEVAEAVGAPSASRAVANACAKNRLAVLVPCHRVLRKDGGIASYRWGIERKQQLLEREAQAVEKP